MCRNATNRSNTRCAGFTLVELLVAMTLIGLLSVAVFGGLRFGSRSWDAVEARSAERDAIAITQSFLRDRMTQIVPSLIANASEIPTEWNEHLLRFQAPWHAGPLYGGYYEFSLWFDPEQTGRLMISWRPAEAWLDGSDAPSELQGQRLLLAGIEDASFSYFGAAQNGEEPVWSDRWDDWFGPPELIRIDLQFAGRSSIWPEFVAAPYR